MAVNPNKVAVLDLGSARTKMLLAERAVNGNALKIVRVRDETETHKFRGTDGTMQSTFVGLLRQTLERFKRLALRRGAKHAIVVATEAFRTTANGRDVLRNIEDIVGKSTLLSTHLEGSVFFEGLIEAYGSAVGTFAAADIGGGRLAGVRLLIGQRHFWHLRLKFVD